MCRLDLKIPDKEQGVCGVSSGYCARKELGAGASVSAREDDWSRTGPGADCPIKPFVLPYSRCLAS